MGHKTLERPGFLPGGGTDEISRARRALDDATAEAKAAWAKFDGLRKSMLDKGVDFSKDRKAFDELDAAGKAHEAAAEKAKDVEARWRDAAERDDAKRAGGRPGGFERGRWAKAIPAGADLKSLTAVGFDLPPALPSGVLALPSRARFLRELIPVGEELEGTDSYSYIRQATRANAAAPVDAHGLKPTSAPVIERVEGKATTIAHLSEPVDRALLEDVRSLGTFLDDEMRLGLLLAEDAQFLTGDGVWPNLKGILNTAGILTQALGADTRSDAISHAITALRLGEVEPDVVVLHPSDWEQTYLEKDSTGNYVRHAENSPINAAARTIWDVGVFATTAIAAGTGLVGWFEGGAELFPREGARVETDSTGDRFTHNEVLVRAEERLGFGVTKPFAFCKLTGL